MWWGSTIRSGRMVCVAWSEALCLGASGFELVSGAASALLPSFQLRVTDTQGSEPVQTVF